MYIVGIYVQLRMQLYIDTYNVHIWTEKNPGGGSTLLEIGTDLI